MFSLLSTVDDRAGTDGSPMNTDGSPMDHRRPLLLLLLSLLSSRPARGAIRRGHINARAETNQ